jgi:rhamnosyltransferase
LDSLVAQTHKTLAIHIRDDGSTDGTLDIIRDYQARFPDIFTLYLGANIGSSGSFCWLLENIEADMYFFCDQDDVWYADKIECHLRRYQNLLKPEMVFSDLEILEKTSGAEIKTLLGLQKMNPYYLIGGVTRILCQNPVAGCAMSLNHAAKKQILSLGQMPEKVVHDHWFAIIATLYGDVFYLPEPLVKYRLHASNQVGSQTFNFRYVVKKLINLRTTILFDLRLIRSLPKAHRPYLLRYAVVKLMANLRRVF